MTAPEAISVRQQSYIETIADLAQKKNNVRVTDLAKRLKISLPSVSETISRMSRLGIVIRKSWHQISLSAKGRAIATQLDHRHRALRRFLVEVLDVDPDIADGRACRMEHFVHPELIERLLHFADFIERQQTPAMKNKWRRHIRNKREYSNNARPPR